MEVIGLTGHESTSYQKRPYSVRQTALKKHANLTLSDVRTAIIVRRRSGSLQSSRINHDTSYLTCPVYDNAQLVLGAAACLGVVGVVVQAYLSKSDGNFQLPPSPPSWRLWGHFIPPHNPSLALARWIDKHGPLITIRSGTEKIVVIGRYNAAVDIMEKQGASIADRPRRVAAGEMLGEQLHAHLQPKVAEEYQPLQMSHAKDTVLNILEDPYNFQNHARTYFEVMLRPSLRKLRTASVRSHLRRILKPEKFASKSKSFVQPYSLMLTWWTPYQWLKYLPWYGRELKQAFKRAGQLYTGQLNRVKQQIQSNVDIGPSFVKHMLENVELHGLSEVEMSFLAGGFFAAGTDTTTFAICTVLMAAACFPEEQDKVQVELDAVIGRHRAPTFADEQSLPRLRAFISEALRWRPLAPEGIAHRTTKEVIWGKYYIPTGTTVVGNHWCISRDPEVFPEPDAFKPERWIDDRGRVRDDLKFFVFGFGRRVCPGQHVATRSVFINSLLILWAFRLNLNPTKPLDDMGFMRGKAQPGTIEFTTRIPASEVRRMMQNYPEER
ncbi:cytochrome P450 [Suillus paluster]|uniref:cytochrome P450 n=1 Tax=Suillus paluster TaxID=48578 RepID=UPI001B87648C|nr:cytochrome P450 [Suillus paluster]KAG1748504.1 cytochrome P450 [Suillus paluster]